MKDAVDFLEHQFVPLIQANFDGLIGIREPLTMALQKLFVAPVC
jgi:hypothetical protein